MALRSRRGLGDRIKTYWKTDQTDPEALGRILGDLGGRLDLVMDDRSRLYSPSKASFEYLFPRMPEGALYIEDWAWAALGGWQRPDHPWANEVPLTRLVFRSGRGLGFWPDVVRSVDVFEGFAIVERRAETRIRACRASGWKITSCESRNQRQGLRSALRNVIKALRDVIKALRRRCVRFLSHHRSSK